eukprot:1864702-Prymnesium_polylepis.1
MTCGATKLTMDGSALHAASQLDGCGRLNTQRSRACASSNARRDGLSACCDARNLAISPSGSAKGIRASASMLMITDGTPSV